MSGDMGLDSYTGQNLRVLVSKSSKGWLTGLGVIMIILGILALLVPLAAGLALELVVGWVLLIGGVAQAAHAFKHKGEGSFGHNLVSALVWVAAGLLLLIYPLSGMAGITLILGIFCIMEGVVKLSAWWRLKDVEGRAWLGLNGGASLAIGLLILLGWPGISLWVLGVFLGVDLIMGGVTTLALAQSHKPQA